MEERVGRITAGQIASALRAVDDFADVPATLGRHSATYFSVLRDLGRHDLTVARVLEPHCDALAILHQAGCDRQQIEARIRSAAGPGSGHVWGVYASRAPQLEATPASEEGWWVLNGPKPWCSLAQEIDFALVTVGTPAGQQLVAVDLRSDGVVGEPTPWVSRGLAQITSTGLTFQDVPALAIGEPGFYLNRDGFGWGGIGVAAIWAGGADGLLAALTAAAKRREPDQIALMHLGRAAAITHVFDAVLADAARRIDAGEAAGQRGLELATHVRTIVAMQAEQALETVGHALGPAPLTADEEHARRVADLTVYLRQHHAERDLAALGAMRLESTTPGQGRA